MAVWYANPHRDKWLERYGEWHVWFAWYPVLLSEYRPTGQFRCWRAWWTHVDRRGIRVGGFRKFEYRI